MTNSYDMPMIPAYVTVHLGNPNENAENVTVSLPDYIKCVSSSLLDPNMPTEALIALMYGQITLALNRITTRSYRKQGKSFDITSDPSVDQYYEYGIPVPQKINELADGIFNRYISREGENLPIFVEICYEYGQRCRGMSVEGAVNLADMGENYMGILEYYFGRNIYIAEESSINGLDNELLITYPLYQGDSGGDISGLQIALNRIGTNYTSIPFISDINGIYDELTVEAVKEFQNIFDLETSGSIDKETFYRLLYIYNKVKGLNELVQTGINLSDISNELRADLEYGSIGNSVKLLQYYLSFVAAYNEYIPPLQIIGVFGEKTYQSVVAFQRLFGFEPNGVVDEGVWSALISVYESLYSALPPSAFLESAVPYFGNLLIKGSVGNDVRLLQIYLNKVAENYKIIPEISVNGEFDEKTENAVKEFQRLFGIKDSGVVSSTTWDTLVQVYNAIQAGEK